MTVKTVLAVGLPVCTCLLASCGGEPAEVAASGAASALAAEPVDATGPATRPGVVRLLERLDTARIEGPLAALAPARGLADLDDPASDLLLDEGFEEFDWEIEGWPRTEVAAVVEEDDGRFLRLEGLSRSWTLGWVLPVETDAFYRFERAIRVRGDAFCDLYVVESRLELEDVRLDGEEYFLAGRGEALKVHSLPLATGEGVRDLWQRESTTFTPTPRTRSLVVLVRPRVGADPGARLRETCLDDVRLEQVFPDREERMRLLKAAHLAEGEDPGRGMAKAGWLLPLPSPEGAREGEPDESNYAWRRALYAPPTTTLAFEVELPEGARLRLATGLARETPRGAAARFQVELRPEGGGDARVLLDEVRTAVMGEWSWNELDVDLGDLAGTRGSLVLRTLAETGDPHPLWANPRLEPGADGDDALVILIAVDTLRADRLSAYGYERETSPALERLAADGVRFDQARSNCNWTCPSFASIFTGLVPSRHGVSSYGPATPLPDELLTLAERFRAGGFATHSIAYKVPLFDGNYEQGFDEAFNVPRDVIRGEENLARALEWLDDRRGGPGFLFLHFNDPHQPFVHPEPWDRRFGEAPSSTPQPIPGLDEDARRRFSDLYDGAVAYVDACIGRFLDAVRERGLYERATIAFVADHGEQLWEHGRFGHGGDDLYDEIVRVPLIVKPPAGTCRPGGVLTADVNGFDVMPTILQLAGLPEPRGLDARSLVPLIRGTVERLERVVATETSGRGLALVDGGFKYVLQTVNGEERLFDLAADPREEHDVAASRPERLARMRALAVAYWLEHRPGSYVLARAGDEAVELTFASRAVRTWVGPELRPSGAQASAAELAAGAWGLFELEDPHADTVAVAGLPALGPKTGFRPWTPGALAELVDPGVYRFHGPEGFGAVEAAAEPVDVEVLEALQRLGYAE